MNNLYKNSKIYFFYLKNEFRFIFHRDNASKTFKSKFLTKANSERNFKLNNGNFLINPFLGKFQPWTLYIASGATLENIRKDWITKNKEVNKGNTDIPVGHRSDFSERCQKCTNDVVKYFGEVLNDPSSKAVWDANIILFNAPTVVYITIPKQRTLYNLFDSGAIEMSVMAAAKEKGVDSVPAYEAIKYPDILRKHMKIGDDEDVVIGIALGYEDKENILSKIKAKKLSVDEL